MINKIRIAQKKLLIVFAVGAFLALFASALPTSTGIASVYAADIKDNLCAGSDLSLKKAEAGKECTNEGECLERNNAGDCTKTKSESGLNGLITTAVNILSLIVGIVAVIMIIIGGFRFITSGGDSGKVGSAKSAVVYAIVGLIVVALAQIIVRFVLGKVS